VASASASAAAAAAAVSAAAAAAAPEAGAVEQAGLVEQARALFGGARAVHLVTGCAVTPLPVYFSPDSPHRTNRGA
jgi:hypothetical protein